MIEVANDNSEDSALQNQTQNTGALRDRAITSFYRPNTTTSRQPQIEKSHHHQATVFNDEISSVELDEDESFCQLDHTIGDNFQTLTRQIVKDSAIKRGDGLMPRASRVVRL